MVNKPYSYRAQLRLLNEAIAAMKVACARLEDAHGNEAAQSGRDGAADYAVFLASAESLQESLQGQAAAVQALADMEGPQAFDLSFLTPELAAGDFSNDERFHTMMDATFDIAAEYRHDPQFVVTALVTAVAQGDQR